MTKGQTMDTFFEHSQTGTFHVKECPALTRESGEGCTCWWVVIERQPENPDAMFGPYPDEDAARLAMEDSILIQSELDPPIGGYDCWIEPHSPVPSPGDNVVLIDLNEPAHTGQPDPDEDGSWVCGRCGQAPEIHATSECVYDPVFRRPPLRIFSTGIAAADYRRDES